MLLVTFDRTSSPENPLHALFHPISLSLSPLFSLCADHFSPLVLASARAGMREQAASGALAAASPLAGVGTAAHTDLWLPHSPGSQES